MAGRSEEQVCPGTSRIQGDLQPSKWCIQTGLDPGDLGPLHVPVPLSHYASTKLAGLTGGKGLDETVKCVLYTQCSERCPEKREQVSDE